MNDKIGHQLAILRRIETKLDRIEENHPAKSSENLDMAQLAVTLLNERNMSFPAGYFSDSISHLLLELYQAERTGVRIELSAVKLATKTSELGALRYVDLLMQDGFVYKEQDPLDNDKNYIILTSRGVKQMEEMFKRFQNTIAKNLEGPVAVQHIKDGSKNLLLEEG